MDKTVKKIIFAVGSLPFWTGERKLVQFLLGDPGSYWDHESPLKPIYLNHYFFGSLEDYSSSRIRKLLETIKSHSLMQKTEISPDKPYKVIKLTSKGVLTYYNKLVLDHNIESPTWWIHHLNQLTREPRSSIYTAGQVLKFSGEYFLTQTPPQFEADQRVKDEKSIRLNADDINVNKQLLLEDVEVSCSEGVKLTLTDNTNIKTVPSSDVQRKLTHFSSSENQIRRENPYMVEGELVAREELKDNRSILLRFEDDKDRGLGIIMPRKKIEERELPTDEQYIVGPVRETNQDGPDDLFLLELRDEGDLKRVSV